MATEIRNKNKTKSESSKKLNIQNETNIPGISGIAGGSKKWNNVDDMSSKIKTSNALIGGEVSKRIRTSSALVGGDAHRKKHTSIVKKHSKNKFKAKSSKQKIFHDTSTEDSDNVGEDEEDEGDGKGNTTKGGGRGPGGPKGPGRGGASGGQSPTTRRSRHSRRPRHRRVYGCTSSQSYIDYKMKSSGHEGPIISDENRLMHVMDSKDGISFAFDDIDNPYSLMNRNLYQFDQNFDPDAMRSQDQLSYIGQSLQEYESVQRKLFGCGAFTNDFALTQYPNAYARIFGGSNDSVGLIKYIQPDLRRIQHGSNNTITTSSRSRGNNAAKGIRGSGKIVKDHLGRRLVASSADKLRENARKMHEIYKKNKFEDLVDPNLINEENAWKREEWDFHDLDAALRDQQVYQVMCRNCGGTGVDQLQLQYRFESVMDLCGGSSWPQEERAKLQKIADFRDSIKLSPDRKKQEEVLKMVFTAMIDDGLALAKLPLAHEIPYIKYFMGMRCGFRMTQKLKDEMLSHDMMALDLLNMRNLKIKIPDEEDIIPGCIRKYTWDSKNKIRKWGEKVAEEVRHTLRRAIVDRARERWALNRSICVPTINCHATFFALLGGREYDWLAVRPWNSGEYRDCTSIEQPCPCVPSAVPKKFT